MSGQDHRSAGDTSARQSASSLLCFLNPSMASRPVPDTSHMLARGAHNVDGCRIDGAILFMGKLRQGAFAFM